MSYFFGGDLPVHHVFTIQSPSIPWLVLVSASLIPPRLCRCHVLGKWLLQLNLRLLARRGVWEVQRARLVRHVQGFRLQNDHALVRSCSRRRRLCSWGRNFNLLRQTPLNMPSLKTSKSIPLGSFDVPRLLREVRRKARMLVGRRR